MGVGRQPGAVLQFQWVNTTPASSDVDVIFAFIAYLCGK